MHAFPQVTITENINSIVPRVEWEHCALDMSDITGIDINEHIQCGSILPPDRPHYMNILWNLPVAITAMKIITFTNFTFSPGDLAFSGAESKTEEIAFADCM